MEILSEFDLNYDKVVIAMVPCISRSMVAIRVSTLARPNCAWKWICDHVQSLSELSDKAEIRDNFLHFKAVSSPIGWDLADNHVASSISLTGLGVTKAPFVNFSVRKIPDLGKVTLRIFQSHLYFSRATPVKYKRAIQ